MQEFTNHCKLMLFSIECRMGNLTIWTYYWGLCGRCLGWWDQLWLRGLAQSKAHACAASLTTWLYTVRTCHNKKKEMSTRLSLWISVCSMDWDAWCLPVLIEWICDEFGIKRDVRQAVAVLHPTDYSWPVMRIHRIDTAWIIRSTCNNSTVPHNEAHCRWT